MSVRELFLEPWEVLCFMLRTGLNIWSKVFCPLERFWSYLPQLLSDFQNLKSHILSRKSPSSVIPWLSSEQLACRHRWRHDNRFGTLNVVSARSLRVLNRKLVEFTWFREVSPGGTVIKSEIKTHFKYYYFIYCCSFKDVQGHSVS